MNNIIVHDGPKISYFWNDKDRNYIVDFYLPGLNCLIEIKDDHVWHKEQVENGKWGAKITAVERVIKNNEYSHYYLIFPSSFKEKTELILDKI